MKKKVLAALLTAVMTFSLAACGGGGGSSSGGSSDTDSDTVKVATVMTSDPDTLDPGRADDAQKNSIVLEAQETLFRLIDGELKEAGCESYETSDDGLTWTFHLRENKYADGKK